MTWFRKLRRELTAAQAEDAMVVAEQQVPPAPAPAPPPERVLCYSPNGSCAHDDIGTRTAPRPACSVTGDDWTRAISPAQKDHAAVLKPCRHCAKRREGAAT
jgi:hypothetical protein